MKFLKSALLFIQLVVLICISINEARESKYIVGGIDAEVGEIPYQVSLQYREQHICGGSILSSYWILTAAHCVTAGFPQENLTILAGTTKLNSGGIRVQIDKIIPHENYKYIITNDIALIKLKQGLTYNDNIQPVNLSSNNIGAGVIGIVSGWGYTDQNGEQTTNDLKLIWVRTISNQQCYRSYQNIFIGNLCTLNVVGEGFCQGDSGGPLVEKNSKAQIGLVSANIPCARGHPDIYTRVSNYIKWIQDNTK